MVELSYSTDQAKVLTIVELSYSTDQAKVVGLSQIVVHMLYLLFKLIR